MTRRSVAQSGGGEADLSMRVGRVAAPLREQVLDVLRQAILDFRLKPGQRLIERELIEQIGVSRTTIREVLRELDAEGLVTTIPQKGAIVVIPTAEEAADLYDVRGSLEALAARRFVERAAPAQVAALRAAVDDFARVVDDGGNTLALLRAKDAIYEVLLDGAGSAAIRTILSGLQARVRMLRAASLSQPGRPQRSVEEMRRLCAALEAGDADAAAEACLSHLAHAATTGIEAVKASPGEPLAAATTVAP
jgi:GntR family transcriptional regulator, trigonelline degradation regulator